MKKIFLVTLMTFFMSCAMVQAAPSEQGLIHGAAFNGDTTLPGSGQASDTGDANASGTGNANGVGHQQPAVVPLPAAGWIMLVGIATMFGVNRKKR